MLDYLGEKEAASSIENAIEKTLSNEKFRTKDLGVTQIQLNVQKKLNLIYNLIFI